MILYTLVALGITVIGFSGFYAGKVLWISMIFNGSLSVLTAFTSCYKRKKALAIHMAAIVALLLIALGSGAA